MTEQTETMQAAKDIERAAKEMMDGTHSKLNYIIHQAKQIQAALGCQTVPEGMVLVSRKDLAFVQEAIGVAFDKSKSSSEPFNRYYAPAVEKLRAMLAAAPEAK
jgi:hypothetical protein